MKFHLFRRESTAFDNILGYEDIKDIVRRALDSEENYNLPLKTHHTSEFMAGYINGSQFYWNNRGYVDGNNNASRSSHNVNYTQGYDQAAIQDRHLFGGLDKVIVPIHNQGAFYVGMHQGAIFTDDRYTAVVMVLMVLSTI